MMSALIAHGDRTDRCKARLKYVLDRMGMPAFLAEAEARSRERRIEPWLQNSRDRLLPQTVHHGRVAQLAHPAARLGDLYPTHRLRPIAAIKQRRDQVFSVLGDPRSTGRVAALIPAGEGLAAEAALSDELAAGTETLAIVHLAGAGPGARRFADAAGTPPAGRG